MDKNLADRGIFAVSLVVSANCIQSVECLAVAVLVLSLPAKLLLAFLAMPI